MDIRKYFPALTTFSSYNSTLFRSDLMAGITVGVMLIPQGMAYALLAGLPPIYGLYAGLVPLLLYAFFGSSRQLSVGPVAIVSILVLAGVGQFAEPFSPEFITLSILTAIMAGIIQVLLGFFRLGFMVNFLSHPVLVGFTSAAAFIIGFNQLPNILGIEMKRSFRIHELLMGLFKNVDQIHLITLFIAIGGIVLIFLLKSLKKNIPASIIVVILSIFLVRFLHLDEKGIALVGDVPAGLPAFSLPDFGNPLLLDLIPLALTICLISFIESLAIAKTIEGRHKTYKVSPNQELIALGITKIGGAFFQSYPTTGSFTRSAINDDSGAQTGMSSIFAAIVVGLTLAFLTPYFYFLPKAILASIIIVAVIGLINLKEIFSLWHLDRKDFLSLAITFLVTLLGGVQIGIITGILVSLAIILYRSSVPHFAVLGRLPNTEHYRNINRFPNAIQKDEVLIIRFDSQLYFGNATYFKESIEQLVNNEGPELKLIILDASGISDLDSSGVLVLKSILEYLKTREIQLYIAGAIGPMRDMLHKSGLSDLIQPQKQFLYVHDAMRYYAASLENSDELWVNNEASQTNVYRDKNDQTNFK